MAITAQDINKLRKMTGAGMMDCKKALTASLGNFEEAIDILRKKGKKISMSRAGRETSEGSVFIKVNEKKTEAFLITLNCETDFVAKNGEFKKLGEEILEAAYSNQPTNIEDLLNISLGVDTVSEKIITLIGKIGEKIKINSYLHMSADQVIPYIHLGNKLGVLVGLCNINNQDQFEAGRDVAMQIAAMNPIALHKDDIPKNIIDRELEIAKEQAVAEGKPEKMIDRIVQGKMNKFFAENTLLKQKFVKDNSITIEKYLDSISKGMTVCKFERVLVQ